MTGQSIRISSSSGSDNLSRMKMEQHSEPLHVSEFRLPLVKADLISRCNLTYVICPQILILGSETILLSVGCYSGSESSCTPHAISNVHKNSNGTTDCRELNVQWYNFLRPFSGLRIVFLLALYF